MKKEKFNLDKEKIYLGALVLAIISIFLPWIKVPLLGSYSAINNWQGIVSLIILVGTLGMYFWDKKYSYLAGIGISAFALARLLFIVGSGMFSSIDLGLFGEISLLSFIGAGPYLLLLSLTVVSVMGVLALKEKSRKLMYYVIGAGVLVAVVMILIANLSSGTSNSDSLPDFDLGSGFGDSSPEKEKKFKEFELGEPIEFEDTQLTLVSLLYEDTSGEYMNFNRNAYVLELETKNTGDSSIRECEFSFKFVPSDSEQLSGTDYYGYSEIFPGAKETEEVKFDSETFSSGKGTIYLTSNSFDGEDCPDFNIRVDVTPTVYEEPVPEKSFEEKVTAVYAGSKVFDSWSSIATVPLTFGYLLVTEDSLARGAWDKLSDRCPLLLNVGNYSSYYGTGHLLVINNDDFSIVCDSVSLRNPLDCVELGNLNLNQEVYGATLLGQATNKCGLNLTDVRYQISAYDHGGNLVDVQEGQLVYSWDSPMVYDRPYFIEDYLDAKTRKYNITVTSAKYVID